LITTAAPASARLLAIANPIPAVEPLITARWPCKSILIMLARSCGAGSPTPYRIARSGDIGFARPVRPRGPILHGPNPA
jgi:hypothetical protein